MTPRERNFDEVVELSKANAEVANLNADLTVENIELKRSEKIFTDELEAIINMTRGMKAEIAELVNDKANYALRAAAKIKDQTPKDDILVYGDNPAYDWHDKKDGPSEEDKRRYERFKSILLDQKDRLTWREAKELFRLVSRSWGIE